MTDHPTIDLAKRLEITISELVTIGPTGALDRAPTDPVVRRLVKVTPWQTSPQTGKFTGIFVSKTEALELFQTGHKVDALIVGEQHTLTRYNQVLALKHVHFLATT